MTAHPSVLHSGRASQFEDSLHLQTVTIKHQFNDYQVGTALQYDRKQGINKQLLIMTN